MQQSFYGTRNTLPGISAMLSGLLGSINGLSTRGGGGRRHLAARRGGPGEGPESLSESAMDTVREFWGVPL